VEIPPEYQPHREQVPSWATDRRRFNLCLAIRRAIRQRDDAIFVRELYESASRPMTSTLAAIQSRRPPDTPASRRYAAAVGRVPVFTMILTFSSRAPAARVDRRDLRHVVRRLPDEPWPGVTSAEP
jgi:hypothetical protein